MDFSHSLESISNGVDLKLETRSEDEGTEKFKAQQLKLDALSGLLPLPDYQLKADKIDFALGQLLADQSIDDYLAGKDANFPDSMDPTIVLQSIQNRISKLIFQRKPDDVKALMALAKQYSLAQAQLKANPPAQLPLNPQAGPQGQQQ